MLIETVVLRRGIKRGVTTLSRDRGWFTGFLAMTGVFLLAQIVVLLLIGLQAGTALLADGGALRLEILQTASPQSLQEFFVAAKDQPMVENVEYITREQAYERERTRSPDLIGFLEQFGIENPFPDTVSVSLSSLDAYEDFAAFVRQPEWSRVVDVSSLSSVSDQEREIREMRSLAGAVRGLTGFMGLLLLITCVAVVTEYVRRRAAARSDEIIVERVAGAPTSAILLPFIAESSILLLAAGFIAGVIALAFTLLIPAFIPSLSAGGMLAGLGSAATHLFWVSLLPLMLLEIIAAVLLATLGSWLAVKAVMRTV